MPCQRSGFYPPFRYDSRHCPTPCDKLEVWALLLLLAVAVVVIEASVLVGLLPKGWTGVIIAVTVAGPVFDSVKRLRAKMLTR